MIRILRTQEFIKQTFIQGGSCSLLLQRKLDLSLKSFTVAPRIFFVKVKHVEKHIKGNLRP